jgi:ribosomal protein L7/L12
MPTLHVTIDEVKQSLCQKHNIHAQDIYISGSISEKNSLYLFQQACKEKNKLEAIKYFREITGASLMLSKNFVINLLKEMEN